MGRCVQVALNGTFLKVLNRSEAASSGFIRFLRPDHKRGVSSLFPSGVAFQHRLRHRQRVEVRQHRQHGRPPEDLQVQRGDAAGGGHPAAVHVLHQRAHQGGALAALRSQARGVTRGRLAVTSMQRTSLCKDQVRPSC